MKSRLWKLCSMVLVFVMLINLLPVQAIALPWSPSDADEATASGGELTAEETVMDDVAVVSEVTDKRTEFSKEYKLSNGLHLAVVYPEAVHYEDNGQWKDIDSTLQAVGSGTNGTYTNRAGAWNVVFPQRLNRNKQVSVTLDGHTVSIGIAGELRANSLYANESTLAAASSSGNMAFTVAEMQTADAQICELDYTLAKESVEYPETVRDKLQSRLVYSDVFENTDILYDLKNDRLKESVVIRQYDDALLGYRYTLDTGTLVPVLNGDGSVDLTEPDGGRILMTMPAPYMIDNAGTVSYDVTVSLVPNGSAYILTYQMPMEWLGDSERAWPVVLDPSITASSARQNVRDQFVAEDYYEDNNHGALYCGYYTYFGKMRTFIKYATIPELQSSDVIINASLSLVYLGGTSGTTTVEAHKVNGTWASETITWDTQPGYNANVEDYANVNGSGQYEWTITDVVRDWYTGENTGVMLKATDSVESGSSVNWKKFYSIDYDMYSPELWPYLSITFRNSNGLESYWDYTSGSAGRAGTGYVNNYSGNLTWAHGDIGFGGNRMPVSISHIYNVSDSAANTYGMGYGWKTNFNQTVSVWDQDSNYYVWEDGDGTRHYFLLQSDGSYQDEDGLELTLTTTGSGTTKYKIADKYGNASYFDTSGRLTKMENNQKTKSSILITYQSSGSKLISKITDGAGRVYNFTYTNGLLNRISYVGKGTTEIAYVSYGYTSSRLTSVTDMDGKSCLYTYDSANHLTSAQDIDGYKLQYTYCTGSPKRVVGISEYDGATVGGTLTIEYAHNQTTFTDHNGNIQITQFNIFGNAVSVQDGQGRAQYVKYARNDDKDTTGKGNQLTLSSKMQNTVSNLLSDGSFELGNSWAVNADTITMSRTTATSYLGNYSLKATSTADGETNGVHSPYVYVAPGETITFSAYVKSSGTPVRLAFHCLYEGYNFLVSGEEIQPSEEWTRTEVSYTNEEDITLRLVGYLFNKTAGVSYIDCAQVELQPTASRYNLIENGDFNGTTGWSSSSGRTTLSDIAAPQLDGNVYRMTGSPTSARSISQTVNVSGGEGDTYVFGGWAKGNSVPLKDENRTFGMELTFHYTDGTTSEETVSFNTACDSRDSWQYVSAPAVAERAYSSITVRLTYDYNANTVYFDGIQLFREEFGTSYGYDENGNLTSVVDLQKQVTEYIYSDNNLTQILQDNKAKVTYTYDAYHNVKTATTQEGIVYSFEYDAYGNNTSVSIGSGSVQITATATYSTDGNILLSTKDALDKVTTYGYNINTNVLEWVQYPEDTDATRTEYSYDTMYRLASAAANTDSGLSLTADYTYTDDLLTAIETPSTTYSFVYGDFAQRSSVKVGTRTLASYTYTNDQNRWLDTMTYGNGDSVSYTYDDYGRVLSETFEDGATVTYQYDNTGALAIVRDSETGIKTTYYYDFTDRLMKYVESGSDYSHSVGYEFDTLNNLTRLVETINGVQHSTGYDYDEDNRITSVTNSISESAENTHNSTREYEYDSLGRVTQRVTKFGDITLLTETISYVSNSTQIASISAVSDGYTITYTYTYDDNGNISAISDGTYSTQYFYDTANQLIRENNARGNYTCTWTYDDAGNITSRKVYPYAAGDLGEVQNSFAYAYGDASWGDLLTMYDGMPITYDSIGNPLTDGVWEYIWQHGRQLSSMYGEDVGGDANDITIEYTYDANGMRIGKIVTKRNYLTHQHSYTETVVPPTCTEGGYTLHECACGYSYQSDETAALGHSYANTVVQSTCTGEGYTVHTCSVCGDSYQDNTTPALGHSYTDTVTAPTCTETGCTTHTCSACGYSYQSDETAALGHSYTDTVTAPTCTETGYTTHTCSVCGDNYQSDETAALGHSYANTVVQSTCTGEGYTVHTCSVCGDSYQDNTTPALGHSYTDTVTAPTCTETGYTTHTCSVCGYSYQSDETAALGHSYTTTVVAPTCTQQGYTLHECSACGDSYQDTYVDALGHNYTTTVVAPTCTEQGYTLHECSACGDSYQDTYVAALGHNYVLVKNPLQGRIVYRCSRCGHIKVEDEIPIIPVDPPVEVASYSLSSGSGEAERILDSTVVQEYAYVYNGSSLMQMVVQTTVDDGEPVTDTLYFSYDASGIPMSLIYNGADYYYTVNLQGDVTAILNTSGTAVVEYTYDAWGNILSITGSMADTLGAVNPLTYRGYVYDTETGLYYLQSRYYNPETGRFLNADAFTTTGQGLLGNNMFAYCLNNPVNYMDPTGHDSILSRIIEWIWAGIKAVLLMCRIMDVKNSGNAIVHQSGEMDVCTDGLLHVPCMDEEGNSLNPYGDTSHCCGVASMNGVYSDSVNYMVVPNEEPWKSKLLGCVGVIINNTTGEYVYALVGDTGPTEDSGDCGASAWDEVSIHAVWILNGHEIGAPIANTRQYGSYTFIIFLNSKQSWDTSGDLQSQIDAIGKQYWP